MAARAPSRTGTGSNHREPVMSPAPRSRRTGEDFDIIIGVLGFWAAVLLIVTVMLELTAGPAEALVPALISLALVLALVLALWGMLRLRRTLPARSSQRVRDA